jgi:hypothetical protein
MVWLNRTEVQIKFIFLFVFTLNFFKMAQSRVRLSPGFLSGAGFPGQEFALSDIEQNKNLALKLKIS